MEKAEYEQIIAKSPDDKVRYAVAVRHTLREKRFINPGFTLDNNTMKVLEAFICTEADDQGAVGFAAAITVGMVGDERALDILLKAQYRLNIEWPPHLTKSNGVDVLDQGIKLGLIYTTAMLEQSQKGDS